MCAALQLAAETVAEWADAHLSAFPPVVIHVTDGEPTDGDPEPIAALIQQLAPDDGNVLLFNLHIASSGRQSVLFPACEAAGEAPPNAGKNLRPAVNNVGLGKKPQFRTDPTRGGGTGPPWTCPEDRAPRRSLPELELGAGPSDTARSRRAGPGPIP
jgi:hypothetical protein